MSNATAARKITYTATAPDGSTHTRKSARVYTHAVLVFGQNWHEKANNLPASWGHVAFSGREDLAQKEAAKWLGHWERVLVVPVTAA